MNQCVDGVMVHDRRPAGQSGSIPASTLHLWINETDDATDLVVAYHYSRRWPSNVQLIVTAHEAGGLFGNKGRPLAAVVYTIPGTRWSQPVLELARLVRRDDARVPLSWLIARSVNILRKKQIADLLVSFADVQQGHHGGVYQAANWHYHGLRAPADEGLTVNGVFVPGRSANSRWGTRSVSKLAEKGITASIVRDQGKHLYWLPITRRGVDQAAQLGLQKTSTKASTVIDSPAMK